jgi:hypothetical protein
MIRTYQIGLDYKRPDKDYFYRCKYVTDDGALFEKFDQPTGIGLGHIFLASKYDSGKIKMIVPVNVEQALAHTAISQLRAEIETLESTIGEANKLIEEYRSDIKELEYVTGQGTGTTH